MRSYRCLFAMQAGSAPGKGILRCCALPFRCVKDAFCAAKTSLFDAPNDCFLATFHFAYATERVSRMTVIFTCPG